MLEFIDFSFSKDKFYQSDTNLPLFLRGITLLKGKNYDVVDYASGVSSNGTGKTRLPQILEGYIYGKNPRGNFKRTVLPDFSGSLKFKDRQGDTWCFSYTTNSWSISKNDQVVTISHKASDCQHKLQELIGLTRDDFNYFVFINQRSLDTLIKGKPLEKKAYLEGFFNIDNFYSKKYEIYNAKLKESKKDIESLKDSKIKLNSLLDVKKDLSGEHWYTLQLELCDTAISLLKQQIGDVTENKMSYTRQIDEWHKYYKLYTQLQEVEAAFDHKLKATKLREDLDYTIKEKLRLEKRAGDRQKLLAFLDTKFYPHQKCKPTLSSSKPTVEKPTLEFISQKDKLLTQMQNKFALKKKIAHLLHEVEKVAVYIKDIPSLDTLSSLRNDIYKRLKDVEDHYTLVQKGGSICPTCKQSLAFLLDGIPPDAKLALLQDEIKKLKEQDKIYFDNTTLHNKYLKLKQELDILQTQYNAYPTFGVALKSATLEVEQLKEHLTTWDEYEKEQLRYQRWESTYTLLLKDATHLGYPDILEDADSAALAICVDKINCITNELKIFDQFDALTAIVVAQPSLSDLEALASEADTTIAHLSLRMANLHEFKGKLRTQLDTLLLISRQIEELQTTLVKQEFLESECAILTVMSNFYSSSGFKVYELKKRCEKLIERANVWSKLFFQEEYTWSLSKDLDTLDFFVQPTNYADDEPYPIALLSAGEYNRAARVLLFSQLELIPPNKKTNLLILDEIESNLDEAGMTAFVEVVLPKLKEVFPEKTIIVISHQPALHTSHYIDHIWLAERSERKTNLKVILNKIARS